MSLKMIITTANKAIREHYFPVVAGISKAFPWRNERCTIPN